MEWQSGILADPRFKNEGQEWDQIALDVFPYTGDRIPEVAVWKQYIGADWAPCHLEVYRLDGHRLIRILSVTNKEDFSVEDLRHDGRYEVWHEYRIGRYDWCAWGDIYAYDKREGRYVLADQSFPREFRSYTRDLHRLLKQNPDDPQLLGYLGIAREIEGRPRAALRAYREAIADGDDWPYDRDRDPPFSRAILVRREAALRARLAGRHRSG